MNRINMLYGVALTFCSSLALAGGRHETVNMPVASSNAASVSTANAVAGSSAVVNTGSTSTSTDVRVDGDDVLPSMSVGNSVSSGTCYAGSNIGGGGGGIVSLMLPFVKEDKQCTYRNNIAVVQQLDQEGARKMLCLLDGYAEVTGDCQRAPVVDKGKPATYKPF